MPNTEFLILLACGVALGWLMGRRDGRKRRPSKSGAFPNIDMLLGDRQSETMNTILNMAEREDAIELQLGLGTFYRRRGELEKSIAIHQNLFARPDLEKSVAEQVQLALATDYLKAGLYDRAERLLQELCKGQGALKVQAIKKLICIYEEEQDWESVLEVGLKAGHQATEQGIKPIAYACCELAEKAMKNQDWLTVRKYIRQALKLDQRCIRALFLESQLAEVEGFPRQVVASLKEILMIDASQLPQVLPKLRNVYNLRHRQEDLEGFLHELWLEDPMPLTLHSLAEEVSKSKGDSAAIELLTQSIVKVPTVEGFSILVEHFIERGEPLSVEYLSKIKQTLTHLAKHSKGYYCNHCGFETSVHQWRCPSCKQWETIKPILAMADLANQKFAFKHEVENAG